MSGPSITEFLTQRWDEIEAEAKNCQWSQERQTRPLSPGLPLARAIVGLLGPDWRGPVLAVDSAYVLADIAAKRRILRLMSYVLDAFEDRENGMWPDVNRRERHHATVVLEELAQPFSEHPAYDQGWSVSE